MSDFSEFRDADEMIEPEQNNRASLQAHDERPEMVAPGLGPRLDLGAIRSTLAESKGTRFWQGLEELAGTPQSQQFLHHEFPHDPQKDPMGLDRRDVLKLMGASAALAGLSACTKLPTERIVPYVRPPEEIIPGKPLFYATSMALGGAATGLLVESNMGRPTKVEGNPQHPGSLGATDVFAQASVLGLYDPDRSQVVMREGRISDWTAFVASMANALVDFKGTEGAGLSLLTETVLSPTLASQIRALLAQYPSAKWHQYEPCHRDSAREGGRLAFGHYVNTVYRFDQADVVFSLDADFLSNGPGHVRYAREFTEHRRVTGPASHMNRLYVVESALSTTGAMADHRLPVRAGDVEALAWAILAAMEKSGAAVGRAALPEKVSPAWIEAAARDLSAHRGTSLVIAGEHQPAIVHSLAHALNLALGNVGKTVFYTDPLEAEPVNETKSLAELVTDLGAGTVHLLVILGGNPVYNAPAELDFANQLLRVPQRVHLGLYNDETAELCHWHIPEAHFLESWSDTRAYDGTVGIVQPLIAPLYDGKSAHEILSVLTSQSGTSAHDVIRGYWKAQRPANEADKDFEKFWEVTLHNGWMQGTALAAQPAAVHLGASGSGSTTSAAAATSQAAGLELVFRPDPTTYDGRFANNGWLQELPKPINHLTWDNPAHVSPATAQKLGLSNGDMVKLTSQGREMQVAVWVSPGHADSAVTVYLGYGRQRAGKVGNHTGFNAYVLRSASGAWIANDLRLERTGERYALAATQIHHIIDRDGHKVEEESVEAFNRDLVRIANLDEFRRNPDFAKDTGEAAENISLYPGFPSPGYAWGMSIDLNNCIGCNACVVACQSENNIPVVGKDQVIAGREMHWIRVDTYFRGDMDNPETYSEPMPCMQCENAPCEVVCPVGATVHSPEGLNVMVYNRCVGTRYCSNNCPYKVRRFNFKLYSDWTTQSLFGMRNPNVTVRSRGVMEKCTYCVQRINAAKIESEKADRAVRDGEIVTACQSVCPGGAIVFGNVNDPNSRVSKLKAQSRNYALLAELNTRPRTTYLARLTNPNPEMPKA
jgi:molybdopterin-containing oxidoreductase family iron-sulfur binding subunit